MALERTLCIVKPDAVEKRKAGAILSRIEEGGFSIVALRMTHLVAARGRGVLRGASAAAVLRRARPVHDALAGRHRRAGARQRGHRLARPDGCDRSRRKRRLVRFASNSARTWARTQRTGRTRPRTQSVEIAYFLPGAEVSPTARLRPSRAQRTERAAASIDRRRGRRVGRACVQRKARVRACSVRP